VRSAHALPGACPVTWSVVAANAATFVLSFVGFDVRLSFHPAWAAARPWTALTYALDGSGSVLALVLSAYALWLFGGSLERAWGGREYARFLALSTVLPALALWGSAWALGRSEGLSGLWLPVAACAVAWSVVNPGERLLVYFAIPVEGRWIGWLAVALVFFSFPFPLGAFALAGCAFAYWFSRVGRYAFGPRPPVRLRNPLHAYSRWRRKREFRRLLRRSGLDDLH
jgi:membrane associated rhomboid family serine protease